MELKKVRVEKDLLVLVPKSFARAQAVLPVKRDGGTVVVAISDISNLFAQDELKFMLDANIRCVVAPFEEIIEAIDRNYP